MNQHLPGRWSFEELLRAEKDKCASEFVPEQLELVGEGRLGKAQFSSSFFIVRRQFTIILLLLLVVVVFWPTFITTLYCHLVSAEPLCFLAV